MLLRDIRASQSVAARQTRSIPSCNRSQTRAKQPLRAIPPQAFCLLTNTFAVSWKWGNGAPSGEVAEIATEGEIAIQSNKGNTIKKNASAEDPAVHITRPGNDVVKRAHELTVEEKGEGATEESKDDGKASEDKTAEGDEKADEKGDEKMGDAADAKADAAEAKKDDKEKENGGMKAGEKRKADEAEEGEEAEQADTNGDEKAEDAAEKPAKKQKTNDETNETEEKDDKESGKGKKGRGRPKKGNKPAAKKRQPKKAATADGEPRRSSRNKA